ncbi:hypothetical protein HKX48_007308 [Thoreauomyces humboldtii]|nr:hypothetical protein HKX48_007308 [Thoreauomyces humboldtii]
MNGTELVDSLLSSLSLTGEAGENMIHCPFDFIIACDLEATCDENHADPENIKVPRSKGEIIELSYAVVSVPERRIVHQRQNYVRPVETIVTPFCTQLTGISPETVENAGSLRDAVEDLLSFIQTNPQSTFCFIGHTEWDFRYQLPRECAEKGISLPPLFNVFFDVCKEVQRMQSLSSGNPGGRTGGSLLSLCKSMGIKHEGRIHSGLDDAVTVANLSVVLLQRVQAYFSEKGDGAVPNGFELPLSMPIDLVQEMNDYAQSQSTVLKLAGVPFKTSQTQVLGFLGEAGVAPESMWMVKNAEGRSDGRGIVVMHTHDDAVTVLRLGSRVIGDRVVHVTPGSDADLDENQASLAPFLTDAEAQQSTAPQEYKNGDWECHVCHFHNFASRRTCSKCHFNNPSPAPFVSRQALKPGDWVCPDTMSHLAMRLEALTATPMVQMSGKETGSVDNATSTTSLVSHPEKLAYLQMYLGTSRVGGGRAPAHNYNAKPGDWTCPNQQCGFSNFAHRAECKVCRSIRPEGTDTYDQQQNVAPRHQQTQGGATFQPSTRQIEVREGDWHCTCGAHNFASRRVCMKCHADRPGHAAAPSANHGGAAQYNQSSGSNAAPSRREPRMNPRQQLRPGDWLCADCSFWNFRSKTVCTRCEQLPAVDAQVVPEGYVHPGSRRDGDWDCLQPDCGFHNFASRHECHRCGEPKQDGQ